MFRFYLKYWINCLVLPVLLFFACNTSKLSYQNYHYLYQPTVNNVQPEFFIFHQNDSFSNLHYFIPKEWNLSVKSLNSDYLITKNLIEIELYESFESKKCYDSIQLIKTDSFLLNETNAITGTLALKIRNNSSPLIQIKITDLIRKKTWTQFIEVTKDESTCERFIILNKNKDTVYHRNINLLSSFYLVNPFFANQTFYVLCYFKSFPIAAPPYSVFKEDPIPLKPDSTYSFQLNNGISPELVMKKYGIYQIVNDTNKKVGYALFNFKGEYPKITEADELIGPIRYITSQKEFNALVLASNKKAAVDAFWIEIAGNADRAKELIKKYYLRVQNANQYFSSHVEGWKTDRGMIYIIYGPPNIVYKSKDGETWIYGEGSSFHSLNFNFYRLKNPFTNNDYELIRLPTYKDSWFLSVENWRR